MTNTESPSPNAQSFELLTSDIQAVEDTIRRSINTARIVALYRVDARHVVVFYGTHAKDTQAHVKHLVKHAGKLVLRNHADNRVPCAAESWVK